MEAFAIRDVKVSSYGTPFFQKNAIEAQRGFQHIVNDKTTMIGMYPEDFELYYLGDYEEVTARFNMLEQPKFIVAGIQLAKKEEAKDASK